MTERLLLLPLRLGLRVTGIVLRPVVGLAERVLGQDEDGHASAPEPPPVRPREPVRWDDPPPRRAPQSRADVPAEPVHVSEEPVVVAEVADEGAEEGPGPQIHVDEPWDGFSKMKAADVIDRLAAATPEERAVVQLYESTHRRRKTVLEAAGYSQRK